MNTVPNNVIYFFVNLIVYNMSVYVNCVQHVGLHKMKFKNLRTFSF